jgi:DNA-binding Xre family transcriptional regulator
MAKKRTGSRIVRRPTAEERQKYQEALVEERAGMEANKALGRELLRERRELSNTVSELKTIREQLGISLTELAERTGMTIGNLSRLENMDGPNPTIETLRRYARALGHRIEIAVVEDA